MYITKDAISRGDRRYTGCATGALNYGLRGQRYFSASVVRSCGDADVIDVVCCRENRSHRRDWQHWEGIMGPIAGRTTSSAADTATKDMLALNTMMFQLYDTSGAIFRRNLLAKHPVIL